MQAGTKLGRFSLTIALAVLVLSSALLVAPGTAQAGVPLQNISSAGPLSDIFLGNELSCQIAHTSDSAFELFPPATSPGDCGTFLVVNDTLYAPDFAGHGGSATGAIGSYTAFSPVSQTPVTGSGTGGDPYQVVTVADAGGTGLRITQTDTYVVGQESYRTDVQVANTTGSTQSAILYRAADCYLGGSDSGYGWVQAGTNAVACTVNANNSPPDRIEQWLPITGGNNYYQAFYSSVWSAISTHTAFPNTCGCDTQQDNGAGISWNLSIPASGQVTRSHLTTFSPTGQAPLTITKTADSPSSGAGGTNGYTITINNPNASAVDVDSVTDTLPAGFGYVTGSTTGATTADPAVSGQDLTWAGPLSVPGLGNIAIHFEVTVASDLGDYFNSVTAVAAGFAVAPTGDTAPVTVTEPGAPTATVETPGAAPTATEAAVEPTISLPKTGAATDAGGGSPAWLLAVFAGAGIAAAAGYATLRLRNRRA